MLAKKIGLAPRGHDSSVVQIDFSSNSIFAEAFERWTRVKHDPRFPRELLIDRLQDAGSATLVVQSESLTRRDLRHFDALAAWNPVSKALRKKSLSKKIWFLLRNPGSALAAVRFLRNRAITEGVKDTEGFIRACSARLGRSDLNFVFTDHHLSHAASAYYFAPAAFKNNSVVVTLDGQGDGSFCKVFLVADNELIEAASSSSSASIPLIFSIATAALGFVPNSDEGKLEALAAYGNPQIDNPIYNLLANCFSVSESLEIVFEGSEEFPFSNVATQWSTIQSFFEGRDSRAMRSAE